jgi:hypothetical protein
VDLTGDPNLVVIYLGMPVNSSDVPGPAGSGREDWPTNPCHKARQTPRPGLTRRACGKATHHGLHAKIAGDIESPAVAPSDWEALRS